MCLFVYIFLWKQATFIICNKKSFLEHLWKGAYKKKTVLQQNKIL